MKLCTLLCLLFLVGWFSAQEIRHVNKQEGEDALLPCTLSFGDKVEFDWRKDGNGNEFHEEVFQYKSGSYPGEKQNKKFKKRVEFFQHELYQSGNASILIKNISLEDNGTYTCGLMKLHRKVFKVSLNLGGVLKSRTNTFGAAVPHIYTIKDEGTWRLLECHVRGVPSPVVEWRNSADEELAKHIPESEYGQAYVELPLYVNMSDNYTCVATQQKIYHQKNSTLPVRVQENTGSWSWMVICTVLGIVVVAAACAIVFLIVKLCRIKKKQNNKANSHRSVDEKLVNMT